MSCTEKRRVFLEMAARVNSRDGFSATMVWRSGYLEPVIIVNRREPLGWRVDFEFSPTWRIFFFEFGRGLSHVILLYIILNVTNIIAFSAARMHLENKYWRRDGTSY